MKTTYLSCFFLLFFGFANGQNAWLDAKILNKDFEFNPARFRAEIDNSEGDEDTVSVVQVLVKYCPSAVMEDGVVSMEKLEACYANNPFISIHQYPQSRLMSLMPRLGIESGEEGIDKGSAIGNGALTGGNFVTRLADGLAIFLVKRTKEELNATFFEGLRKKMDEEPVYHALFPATADLLYVIGTEIYNYNAYIESLREGFLQDLQVLPTNLKQFALDNTLVKKPEVQIAVEDLLTISQMVMDANKPFEILDYMSGPAASIQDSLMWRNIETEKTRKAMQDVAMSLRMFQTLLNSVTTNEGEDWVSTNEVKVQMSDISHVYLYLGLLWQQGEFIQFSDGKGFRTSLGKFASLAQTPIELRNFMVSLVQTGQLLQDRFKKLVENPTPGAILNAEYGPFADQLFSLFEQAQKFRHLVVFSDWKIENGKPKQTDLSNPQTKAADSLEFKLVTASKELFNLEFNVKRGHYSLAVLNLTHLLDVFLTKDQFKFRKQFLRHANFMATVAEAQNAKQVAAAIELFALPPGSSRMKKESPFSVSLNSYGGIAGGLEFDIEKEVKNEIKKGKVLAPSAPVGIDFNFGMRDFFKCKKNTGSLSIYAQVIDVGALFAYRFTNETESIPDLKFQNIIAPGGYLIYGFGRNIPLSLGVGAQLGPNLRKVDPNLGLDIKTTNAWRFGVIASVDIPITHFYSK